MDGAENGDSLLLGEIQRVLEEGGGKASPSAGVFENCVYAFSGGEGNHRGSNGEAQLLHIVGAETIAPAVIILPTGQDSLSRHLEIAVIEGQGIQPFFRGFVGERIGHIAAAHSVDKAGKFGTFGNFALIKKLVYHLERGSVLGTAAQKKLAAADVGAKLLLLHKEKIVQLPGGGDSHHIRDLLNGKTVVFEPKAVHEKIDMPSVIIAVIIV